MKINKDSLKARANNISKELNVSQNTIYSRFFFDAFLARLVSSTHKDKLVLKGGLYLSSILGIDNRSTVDMDFYTKRISMEKDIVLKAIDEIISTNLDDGIIFKIISSSDIREDDMYGGVRVTLLAKLDNVKQQFDVDVATGDPIVPSERSYDYKCLVSKQTLPLKAYSLESVISEKLETILARGIANSRSKDFYDLYILRKTQFGNVDLETVRKAFEKTCEYRKFYMKYEDAIDTLEEIAKNDQISTRWLSYGNITKYANDIPLIDVVTSVKDWINICYLK